MRRPIHFPDLASALPPERAQPAAQAGLRTGVAVPVIVGDHIVAILEFFAAEPAERSRLELVLLAQVAAHVARVFERDEGQAEIRRAQNGFENFTRALLRAAPHPIVVLDLQGRILHWSRAAAELYGWSDDELRGRIAPFLSDDERLELLRDTDNAIVRNRDMRHVRRDGSVVLVSLSAAPLCDSDGRTVGMVLFIVDSSEARRLADRLQSAQRMETVGRLAGGIAHDFNNMLTTISGFAQLLATDEGLDEEQRSNVAEILKAAKRSTYVTRQLLAYSRQQVLQPRRIELPEVVDAMLAMLRTAVGESITIQTRAEGPPAPITADRAQIEQLLLNLVLNARDAMPEGGVITIDTGSTTHTASSAAHIEGLRPGAYALLSVSDTGRGIAPDVLPHIFEPFFTTKGPAEATGLGLATVDGVVHQNGGGITVETELGKGSRFTVYLPIAEAMRAARSRAAAHAEIDRGPATILVTEDEEAVRRLIARLLERAGFRILTAASPNEAIRIFDEHAGDIDLLLTDIIMPGMSGVALADLLSSRNPELRVLLVSGYSHEALGPDRSAAGRNFLEKPFEPAALIASVRELLA